MAKDFDISPLSGIGPATITVKPKSVNDSESIRDQVIKVVVQGVEREITLVQKGAPPSVETWRSFLRIEPTSLDQFTGSKRNETKELSVYSYEQKYVNDQPQEVYRSINFSVEGNSDWLDITTEVGDGNNPGKVIFKTLSYNPTYNPSTYVPLSREVPVRIVQNSGDRLSVDLTIVQGPGERTEAYGFEPTPHAGHGFANQNASKQVTVQGYEYININGTEVSKSVKPFKIPTIAEHKTGNFGIIGQDPVPWEAYITDYPSSVVNTFINQMTCVVHFNSAMAGGIISVTWDASFSSNGQTKTGRFILVNT